jgi:hypothetical protein
MMLQRLMNAASLDCDMSNNKDYDYTDEYVCWIKIQNQIKNLVIEQRIVNDLLITAKVLAQENVAKMLPDCIFYTTWTRIVKMLEDINLESFCGQKIAQSMKDLLWFYKEAQKGSFVDLDTAKYWFEFLQRLESMYQKQCDICIWVERQKCEVVNICTNLNINPIGENDKHRSQFWVPIAKKLQDCVW